MSYTSSPDLVAIVYAQSKIPIVMENHGGDEHGLVVGSLPLSLPGITVRFARYTTRGMWVVCAFTEVPLLPLKPIETHKTYKREQRLKRIFCLS